jgi:hypothetical protein
MASTEYRNAAHGGLLPAGLLLRRHTVLPTRDDRHANRQMAHS